MDLPTVLSILLFLIFVLVAQYFGYWSQTLDLVKDACQQFRDGIPRPHRRLREKGQAYVQQQVEFRLLTLSDPELLSIARRITPRFRKALEEAERLNQINSASHSLGQSFGSLVLGLNEFGRGISAGLASKGLALDIEMLEAMQDADALGAHEHDPHVFDESCARCKWLADDVRRPKSSLTSEDYWVQFDIRRQRIQLLEDSPSAVELLKASPSIPEDYCSCVNERGTSNFHVRSCPKYGQFVS